MKTLAATIAEQRLQISHHQVAISDLPAGRGRLVADGSDEEGAADAAVAVAPFAATKTTTHRRCAHQHRCMALLATLPAHHGLM